MRWTYRIAFALLAAIVAGAVARADDQPKYATMGRGWTPPVEQQAPQQMPPQQQQMPTAPQQTRTQPVQTRPVQLASVQQSQSFGNSGVDYRLGTGDKVRVTVYGEDDLSGEFQVDSTGTLRLPIIGQVRAAGLTAKALEDSITATYGQGYLLQPRVNVEVTAYRPFYIIGEVNRPGEYAYVNGMNVLNAVALAGGFTTKATEGHVYLRKAGTSREITVAADQLTDVMPGDIVRVGSNPLMDVLSIVSPIAPLVRY
jgi:polysaccharide export outer membrane protein